MENNYYIPAIEDIRIGYECELLAILENSNEIIETWKKTNIYNLYIENREEFMSCIRVPFLTKEQIEAEGYYCTNTVGLNFQKVISDDLWWELDYDVETHNLTIECWVENHSTNKSDCFTKFDGECKSINEFRYVCKLLKI